MLEPIQIQRGLSPVAVFVTVFVHCLAFLLLTFRPEPRLLQPSAALRGDGGNTVTHVALVAPGSSVIDSAIAKAKHSDQALEVRKRKKPDHASLEPEPAVAENSLKPGMPGFILGSLANGLPSDHDVRVALPVIAPDPPILHSKLPDWLRGDVIIEVTIDEQGNVVKTKVLKTVGFGIEDIVTATLRQWRFSPAKIDGISVASRQDVYFHFPG
ncbi:MAG TPA: energy transducer TonB [Terriglobales bacterium]|nr:energy transducer TonB [Terriglobales bacterium]